MLTLAGGKTFVWDNHAGFELRTAQDLESISEWKTAGVDFLSINVGYDVRPWQSAIEALALARNWLRRTSGYALVSSVAEIDRAVTAGNMAVAFDIEGANALDGRLDMIGFYYDLGVRQMALAYNVNNIVAGGCHDNDVGLSRFGRDVVAEMNAVGMIVDCSHCGYRTTLDAIACSREPVIFSHSNSRALRDHERNIWDDQAKACADTGGVIGVNGISHFVGDDDVSAASIVDHIEHYLALVGPKHVGIGLDHFPQTPEPSGFNDTLVANQQYWPAAQYPATGLRCAVPGALQEVARTLHQRGHSEAVISAVLGGNFRRVASAVWQ
ncbi:MAG: dipeptidase [Gammaproteobacteria bacterium]|nr:dipeptidase [Gammaproteobacteria bacterium]